MVIVGTRASARAAALATGFRPDIEGMRAVAVLLVVLFHAGLAPLSGGFIGVDVFFVISGFLITRLLLLEVQRSGGLRLREFWARRARRLLPASALVLVTITGVTLLVVDPLGQLDTGRDVTAASVFLANWWFAGQSLDYFAADRALSPVLHFWSLSVEEQYYLLWPPALAILVWWLRRRGAQFAAILWAAGALLVAAAVASFGWSVLQTAEEPVRAYYGTPARAWELAIGGLVAVVTLAGARVPVRAAGLLAWAGLAAIGVAALTITESTPFPGTAALAPVLGTAVVLLAGATPGAGGPLPWLGARLPRELGRLSYSWYLWHWPFLVLAPAVLGRDSLGAATTVVVVLASLLAAWLTFRLLEDPVRRSRWLAAAAWRSLCLGGALVLLGVAAGQVAARAPMALSGVAGQGPGGQGAGGVDRAGDGTSAGSIRPDPLKARADTNRIRADGCQSLFDQTEVRECVYGEPDADQRWVLWGDSHAVQWFPALEANALEAGVALQVFGKTSCPPSLVPLHSRKWDRTYDECTTWRDEVWRQVQAMPAGTVVFLTGMHEYAVDVDGRPVSEQASEPIIAEGWRQVAERLSELGMVVVPIRDTPFPPFEVPACVAANRDDPSRCDFPREGQDRGTSWEQRTLGEVPGVRVLDLRDEVCGERSCPAVVDGILRWRDRDHLTATYVATLAEPMRAELRRIGVLATADQ
ncbi:MAG TPA: acyltransferase family protein [Candidatus Nanopelagicales bacterium]